MAIQTINLTVPGGDTPRSANTKINANFSNTTHAASRLVGEASGNVLEYGSRSAGGFISEYGTAVVSDIFGNGTHSRWSSGSVITTTSEGTGNMGFGSSGVSHIAVSHSVGSSQLINHRSTTNRLLMQSGKLGIQGIGIDENTWGVAHLVYTTGNTTKDSNGFLKAASPIVKVFADKVELNTDAENQNVTYKKNGVGDYTITTVSGLSTDGWYIELPKDMNGNPKVAVTLSEVDGVISLKSYKRIFSMETFTFGPDLEQPLDIPEGRWIDLRLNEIPVEPTDLGEENP